MRFRTEPLRNRFIMARTMLRNVVAHYLGEEPDRLAFRYTAYGKPYLPKPRHTSPLHFNLTHTSEVALLALARCPVGIDVERFDGTLAWQSLVEDIFTDGERDQLLRCPTGRRRHRFFQLWTRKEAYMKGRGFGFFMPLKSVSVLPTGEVLVAPEWTDNKHWTLNDLVTVKDHSATVAAAHRPERILCFEQRVEGFLRPKQQ